MQKYFISHEEYLNQKIISDDVFHITTVMRFKPGDKIIVSDEENESLAVITEINKKYV